MSHTLMLDVDLAPDQRSRPRPRMMIALGVCCLVLLVSAVSYAVVRHARVTKSTLVARLASPSVVAGERASIEGWVTPASSSRVLRLQVSTDGGLHWQSVRSLHAAPPDGSFTAAYTPPAGSPSVQLRVVAARQGHSGAVMGKALPLAVLSESTVNAVAPSFVARGRTLTVSGTVKPATSGRSVHLEESSDGTTWVATGATSTTDRSGNYTLTTDATDAGPWSFRVVTAANDQYSTANSAARSVVVEDVKAAGRFYLKTVAPTNKLAEAWNAMADAYSAGQASFVDLRQAIGSYAKAERRWVNQLSSYNGWPHTVAGLIKKLVASATDEYGALNTAATATDLTALDSAVSDSIYPSEQTGNFAEQIRQQLHLPARS